MGGGATLACQPVSTVFFPRASIIIDALEVKNLHKPTEALLYITITGAPVHDVDRYLALNAPPPSVST